MTHRKTSTRTGAAGRSRAILAGIGRGGRLAFRAVARRPGVTALSVAILGAASTFGWNALVQQPTRHPAPLFAKAKPDAAPVAEPPRRPEVAAAPLPVPRPDGVTAAAAKTPPEPAARSAGASDPIGTLIRGGEPAAAAKTGDTKPAPVRVAAAQKALSKLGYGPITADGVIGASTRQALERFERDRNLPVTGGLGPRTKRQLAARSGVQVE